MKTSSYRIPAVVLLTLLMAHGAVAQQLLGDRPPRKVTERPQEFPETFTSVRSLTSLPDGRLVISDASDKKVYLLDFAKGVATPLARTGTGPREYQDPGGTYRAPGGGVRVYDQRQLRFLPIDRNGRAQDVVALPFQPTAWGASENGPDAFVPDTLGNIYLPGQAFTNGRVLDSVPLIHVGRHGLPGDTVGFLRQTERRSMPSSQPGVTMGQMVAFSATDIWAVAADGGVAIVKANPYRVDWLAPDGKVTRGAPIPYTPLRVTSADRDSLRARVSGSSGRVSINGQNQAVQAPKVEPIMKEVKPPFLNHLPRIDERGRLWVERSGTADATSRTYDLFDRRGALTDRVEIPAGSRLVGFDASWMYTVRKDEDDLLHLQRYKMP